MKYRIIRTDRATGPWELQRRPKWKFWKEWEFISWHYDYSKAMAAINYYRDIENKS